MIRIDGALGEGGGQILRTSLALSTITGQSCEIINIRARRPKPGLRPQHRQCVLAAARIAGGDVSGADIGSQTIVFRPRALQSGLHHFDIGTAGSTALLLHGIYLPMALSHAHNALVLNGGTHVPFAPSYHYLEMQWLPWMRRIGLNLRLKLKRAGYYPRGGGRVEANLDPVTSLNPLNAVARGALRHCAVVAGVTGLPLSIAERMVRRAERRLTALDIAAEGRVEDVPGVDKGAFLLIHAEYEAGGACYCSLGAKGKPAEKVADATARAFTEFHRSEGVIDEYLGDQIMLPLAATPGESRYRVPFITEHMRTNAVVIEQFLDAQIHFQEDSPHSGLVVIEGTGGPR